MELVFWGYWVFVVLFIYSETRRMYRDRKELAKYRQWTPVDAGRELAG